MDQTILILHKRSSSSAYDVYCKTTPMGKCGAPIGEFYREVSGYYVWEPLFGNGYLTSDFLRAVADKLDELNKEWDDELRKSLENLNG